MAKLKFNIVPNNTDTPWHVRVDCNSVNFFDSINFNKSAIVEYDFDNETEDEYTISITLQGKRTQDTVVDSDGNIVKDSVLDLNSFVLDGVDVTKTVFNLAKYQHNFNGNGNETLQPFYGTAGCNGTIEFKFSSPTDIWLLENM